LEALRAIDRSVDAGALVVRETVGSYQLIPVRSHHGEARVPGDAPYRHRVVLVELHGFSSFDLVLAQLVGRREPQHVQPAGDLTAVEVPDVEAMQTHHAHGESMPGMLTEAELAELRAASGPKFDRLFLTFMQRHHEGALQMISELFDAGGGEEPEVFQFANHVDADQRIELGRIAKLLADMNGSG
jgi:hypothetical protein